MTNTDQARRLSDFLKDAHLATLNSVRVYGWWEMYDEEEIRLAVTSEIFELKRACELRDWHGPHGVLQEAMDCIVVLIKAILRLQDMAERGEI